MGCCMCMYCASDAAKNRHRLSNDALIQVWEEILQDPICKLIESMPRCCQRVIQAHRAIHSMSCYNTNLASGISLSFQFFTLNFGVILAPAFIGFMILVAFDRC